jgi:hypothetical protein
MAVRRPVKLRPGFKYEIQEMTNGEIDLLVQRMLYLYALNPSVTLSYVGSSGNLDAMTDTRYQAGTFTSRVDRFATEAETPNISLVTVTYDTVSQTVATGTGSYYQSTLTPPSFYPAYWDSATGSLQAMSIQDMIDTFVAPAVTYMATSSNTQVYKQGTYFISTSSSVANATLVNASPIFTDTTANAAAYTSGGIPEALDQPVTVTNYYLHRWNAVEPAAYLPTVQIWPQGATTNLIEHSSVQIDTMLESFIREATIGEVGHRLRYTLEPTSNARPAQVPVVADHGSLILNTILSGSSASGYTTRFVGVDDYRTQEFPNGTPTTAQTYGLRIYRS